MILDDPLRGVDAATKGEIYDVFRDLARNGVTLLLLSTEIEELITCCDRVAVFREFEVSAVLEGATLTREAIVAASLRLAGDRFRGCATCNERRDRPQLSRPVQLALDLRGRHAFHSRLHGRRARHHLGRHRPLDWARRGHRQRCADCLACSFRVELAAHDDRCDARHRGREWRRDRVAPCAFNHCDARLLLVLSGLTLEILPMSGGRAPDWMIALGGRIGVFPLPLLIPAALFLAWAPIRASAFGRNLLASGGELRAALASGIDVALTRFVAIIASSVIAAATGFAFTVSLGSGDPTAATPYTLIGIAGAVLGGVSLSGGRGGLLGAAAGGAVLYLVQNLLSLAHVSAFYAQIAYGVILLVALALNSFAESARHRRDHLASLRLSEEAVR